MSTTSKTRNTRRGGTRLFLISMRVAETLWRYWRNWVERQKLARLLRYDEYRLEDIGITRDDLYRVLHQPLDRSPACELRRRAREHARQRNTRNHG